MSTLRDIKSFVKLFDIKIPTYDHFDYYVEQLSNLARYSNIKEWIDLYIEAESHIGDMYEYRLEVSKKIIDFVKERHAFQEMLSDNNLIGLPTNKTYSYDNKLYVSIDMISANFNSIKRYDQRNELGSDYNDLLTKFNVPEVFKHSKYFRQVIFGNLNPKRQQLVQRNMIQQLVRNLNDFTIEAVRNDEVVISIENINEYLQIKEIVDQDLYKIKLFRNSVMDDCRIERQINSDGELISKDIYNLNGNMLYWKIKEYITPNHAIEDRDLYFRADNHLAKWVISD